MQPSRFIWRGWKQQRVPKVVYAVCDGVLVCPSWRYAVEVRVGGHHAEERFVASRWLAALHSKYAVRNEAFLFRAVMGVVTFEGLMHGCSTAVSPLILRRRSR